MTLGRGFPRLVAGNHRVTSPPSPDYNCIARAAGDTNHWWEPGVFWPVTTRAGDYGIDVLILAFQALGYEACADGGLEPGIKKVALFGDAVFYTHAARQLPDGKWTSKLGPAEDIEHDSADAVAGGVYGEIFMFMRRPIG
jgi:hypothetical protein